MMKKFALALLCALNVLFFSNCSKEDRTPDPFAKFVKDEGYVQHGSTVNEGDTMRIKVECTAADSKDLLTHFNLTVTPKNNSSEPVNKIDVDLGHEPSYSAVYEIVAKNIGVYNIKMTVTAQSGHFTMKNIDVTSVEVVYGENDFEWYRHGSNLGVGLEMFGLRWANNYKDICASIMPVDTLTVDFRILNDVDFEKIANREDVIAEFEKGKKIKEFHEISCEQASATYDHVIATHVHGNNATESDVYYVMNVKKSTAVKDNVGTKVTITGRYKWADAE